MFSWLSYLCPNGKGKVSFNVTALRIEGGKIKTPCCVCGFIHSIDLEDL